MLEFDETDGYFLSGIDSVVLANGKVSFETCPIEGASPFDVRNCIVTRSMDLSKNQVLLDNTVATPNFGRWAVSSAQDSNNEISISSVEKSGLDMRTAIHHVEAVLKDESLRVELDRYAVYHLPYCCMHSMQVTSSASYDLHVKHFVTLPKNDYRIVDVIFSGNVIATSTLDGIGNRHVMIAQGRIADSGAPMCFGVMYTIDDPAVTTMKGFQMLSQAGREAGCVAIFQVQENYPCVVHALTCAMTGHDFPDARESVMRCLLSAASTSTPLEIRVDHVSAWSKLWEHNLILEPKYSITPDDMAQVQKVKRAIRQSLYTLYSRVRPGVSAAINIGGSPTRVDPGAVDIDGSVLSGDDMWLLPALTCFNPSLAKSLIEFRYRELELATTAASQLGYGGVKYPSITDDFTANTPYSISWSAATNSKIYNTALVGVHAWNYYRATADMQFLSKVGFPILNGVANFLITRSTIDPNDNNKYDLISVTDADGNLTINEVMNVFLAKLALNCAIEAAFVMNVPVYQEWMDVKNGLHVDFISVEQGIPIPFLNFDSNSDKFMFPGMLYCIFPMFLRDFMQCLGNNEQVFNADMYRNMIVYSLDHMKEHDYEKWPRVTCIALCANLAYLARTITVNGSIDVLYPPSPDTYPWDFAQVFDIVLKTVGNVEDFTTLTLDNCAAFLLLITSGFMDVYIKGGIAPGMFAYSNMEIYAATSSVMPSTWQSLKLDRGKIRGSLNSYITINSVPYESQ